MAKITVDKTLLDCYRSIVVCASNLKTHVKHVLISFRGSEHDGRNVLKLFVLVERAEGLSAVHARHIQVQQNEIRAGRPISANEPRPFG
jgi:hypothetical protein